MYRIDDKANRITRLEAVRFSDLGFTERSHLQEWLANQPDALGEELLIIQKEFDGFDDTRERLDLLALDKQGRLVVIENKLDDSGRDVVWQGLKYASYCSTLSKTSIADIFQRYLDRQGDARDAKTVICEFLAQEDFALVNLNQGKSQRLFMVAAQFRKEVTSTVLWLMDHGLAVKCFKATPFRDGEALYLSVEQVIPLPEAEEFMIRMSEKEAEEQSSERGQATRYQLRMEFWHQMLDVLQHAGFDLYSNVSPSKDHWLNAGSGLSGVHYTMIFSRDEARVEFVFDRASKEQNKALFDRLFESREGIEKAFGATLTWRRMEEKKASIIAHAQPFDGYDKDTWPEMTAWLLDHIRRLKSATAPHIQALRATLAKDMP